MLGEILAIIYYELEEFTSASSRGDFAYPLGLIQSFFRAEDTNYYADIRSDIHSLGNTNIESDEEKNEAKERGRTHEPFR